MDKEKIGGVDSICFMRIPSGYNSMHTKKIISYLISLSHGGSKVRRVANLLKGVKIIVTNLIFFQSNPTRYSELVFHELVFSFFFFKKTSS